MASGWPCGMMDLPPALRRMVLEVVGKGTVTPASRRWYATPRTRPAAPPPPPTAAPADDVVRALSYLPPPADAPQDAPEAVVAAPPPSAQALDRATALFLQPPPAFLYSAPRFLHLPVNSRIPEVCILGRSNVGKSTLLNALAGLETGGHAGRSHGARPGRRGLAITSARAGCTTMMNGYGFGPPLRPGARGWINGDQPAVSPSPGGSRSQRRARSGEPAPARSLVLIDLPGYGFMSQSAWGVEIGKLLQRRAALRGAVLLVDAVAGLKDGDRQALALLRDASVRTLVVLTKADKVVGGAATAAAVHDSGPLRSSCLAVWHTLHKAEQGRWSESAVPWMAGQGWERGVVVTGAGDPKSGGFGVAGARLAICRLAGLLPAEEAPEQAPKHAGKKRKSKKTGEPDEKEEEMARAPAETVVPFDQIQWAATSTETAIDQSEERRFIAEQEAARAAVRKTARPLGRKRPWRQAETRS